MNTTPRFKPGDKVFHGMSSAEVKESYYSAPFDLWEYYIEYDDEDGGTYVIESVLRPQNEWSESINNLIKNKCTCGGWKTYGKNNDNAANHSHWCDIVIKETRWA